MKLYEDKYDMATGTGSIFKQIDREQSLIYLMRVNLLKRLESSIYSFRLTLDKLVALIEHNIELIEKNNNSNEDLDLNITDIEIDDTELEDMLVGGKTKVLIKDMDTIRWQQDLENDLKILNKLQGLIDLIDVENDAKLYMLKNVIHEKVKKPINDNNYKVIIFTAFSDTASYLYDNLSSHFKQELKLNSALVTGSETNKTNLKGIKTDLNSILTNFSPISKKRNELYSSSPKEEIDILFCTDCISEGQNLQDCDYLINYDIHWNPVRIIQRFGRIDRIGSKNKQIQLVNFYPNIELDSFIELIAKVKGRMVMLDVSASGEENIIKKDSKEMQDLDYRKRQLQKLQEQVIDLEDIDGNISITDLTFNDFKIDIDKTNENDLKRIDELPVACYSVTASKLDQIKPGVIFCFKEEVEQVSVNPKDNLLYPYYLVYISENEETILKGRDTKKVLDYFRKLGMGNRTVNSQEWSNYNIETKNDRFTGKYKKLVDLALNAIHSDQKEIGLDALAKPGVQNFSNPAHDSKERMTLLSYLIIR
jgi:superfamily II DNA or RNA helicase